MSTVCPVPDVMYRAVVGDATRRPCPPSTPLVRLGRYFAERAIDERRVLALVGLLALAGPAAVYGVTWIFTAHVDGTVMVDNPDRPADFVCESDSEVFDQSGCSEPREVERDADGVIRSSMDDLLWVSLAGGPLVWLLSGILLHAGSWLSAPENGVVESFGVAAWGLVPTLVGILLLLPVLFVLFEPVTMTPGSEAAVLDAIRADVETFRSVAVVVTLATTAWGATVWRYGLEHERGLDGTRAWVVAGVVAAVLFLLGLA